MSITMSMFNIVSLGHDMAECNRVFAERRDQAVRDFFSACKYPRKKKKRIREQCREDYSFYANLVEFNIKTFNFL